MVWRLVLCSVTVAFSAGCATTGTSTPSDRVAAVSATDCLRNGTINGWHVLDDRNLIVHGTDRRPYHFVLDQSCYNIERALRIAFVDPAGDSRVCAGTDRLVFEQGVPGGCTIASIDELTAEQAEELRRQDELEDAVEREPGRR